MSWFPFLFRTDDPPKTEEKEPPKKKEILFSNHQEEIFKALKKNWIDSKKWVVLDKFCQLMASKRIEEYVFNGDASVPLIAITNKETCEIRFFAAKALCPEIFEEKK